MKLGLFLSCLPDVSFTLKDLGKHLGESGEVREEAGGREGVREDKSPSVEAGGRLEGVSRCREWREARSKLGGREAILVIKKILKNN